MVNARGEPRFREIAHIGRKRILLGGHFPRDLHAFSAYFTSRAGWAEAGFFVAGEAVRITYVVVLPTVVVVLPVATRMAAAINRHFAWES